MLTPAQEIELKENLKGLFELIIRKIAEKVPNAKKEIIKKEMNKYSFPYFKYDKNGPSLGMVQIDKITKEHTWVHLPPSEIETAVIEDGGDKYSDKISAIINDSLKDTKDMTGHTEARLLSQDLILRIIVGLLDSELTNRDEFLKILTEEIIHTIKDEAIDSKILIKLENFVVGEEEIKFTSRNTEYLIRQTKSSDINYEVTNAYDALSHDKNMKLISNPPTAIMVITKPTTSVETFYPLEAERVVAILRLFKTSGVDYISMRRVANTILGMPPFDREPFDFMKRYLEGICFVDKSENAKFIKFFNLLDPVLPKGAYDIFRKLSDESSDYIIFSYDRYCDSLSKFKSDSRKITEAIIGLEALFDYGEPIELTYKLKTRVAKLLGYLGKNPEEVAQNVNKACRIRGGFVHGGISNTKEKELEELRTNISDYLRIAIVLFFVAVKSNKGLFITALDNLIIDSSKDEKFIKDFNLDMIKEVM
jgi:hypothetical protein